MKMMSDAALNYHRPFFGVGVGFGVGSLLGASFTFTVSFGTGVGVGVGLLCATPLTSKTRQIRSEPISWLIAFFITNPFPISQEISMMLGFR